MNKQKLRYMRAVAKYLTELGYRVEPPTTKHDLLDVWGRENNRSVFVEIYLHAFSETDSGLYGVWGQGENNDEELYLDNEYGLDIRFAPMLILDDLKPFKTKRARGDS